MHIDLVDYILGLAHFTAELMRMAIGSAANGDTATPFEIRILLNKCRVAKNNLEKVERTYYDITIRWVEMNALTQVLP